MYEVSYDNMTNESYYFCSIQHIWFYFKYSTDVCHTIKIFFNFNLKFKNENII